MKTLSVGMKEMETKKRLLEEAVDSMNEEVTKVRAEGLCSKTIQAHFVAFLTIFNVQSISEVVCGNVILTLNRHQFASWLYS